MISALARKRVGKEKEVEDKGHRGKGKRGRFNLKFETLFPLYPRERKRGLNKAVIYNEILFSL